MVVRIIPLFSGERNSSPDTTKVTSKTSGNGVSVSKPQQEDAATVWATMLQSSSNDVQEEPCRKSAGNSLANLGGTRLSILQGQATDGLVYRGLNPITKEVEDQFASEKELASSAFLREIKGTLVNEKT